MIHGNGGIDNFGKIIVFVIKKIYFKKKLCVILKEDPKQTNMCYHLLLCIFQFEYCTSASSVFDTIQINCAVLIIMNSNNRCPALVQPCPDDALMNAMMGLR